MLIWINHMLCRSQKTSDKLETFLLHPCKGGIFYCFRWWKFLADAAAALAN